MQMESVSAVLVVKDAADDLARCLDSLRWTSEIIVVDSFSSDNTVEIARRYTDKIVQRPWPGYAQQKNHAISLANSAWVLSIDADEVLPPETISELQQVLSAPGAIGYRFPRRNIFMDHWVQGCGWYPDWQTRLVRKGQGEFLPYNVHESLAVNGPVGTLNNPILHYSYKSFSHYFGKSNQYTNLEVQDLAANNTPVSDLEAFQGFASRFIWAFWQQGGFRDGLHGLAISLGQGVYEFFKYLKAFNYYQNSGKAHLIRRQAQNPVALGQFKAALTKNSQLNRGGRPRGHYGSAYTYQGLNAALEPLRRGDANAFLGEANRLSDADADRITPSLRSMRDIDLYFKPLEAANNLAGADWRTSVLAMGTFTYALMVWAKVWERLVWNNRSQAVQGSLDQRTSQELVKSIQWASRYLWFARRG